MQLSIAEARAAGIALPSKPKRQRKPPPPDVYVDNDCVILAIDPGETSGYAIVVSSKKPAGVACGTIQGSGGFQMVVTLARDRAIQYKRPLVVVAETWTTGNRTHDRRMHAMTLLGLGAAWERWRAVFRAIGLPRSRVVRVNVATWRSKVIGGPMNRTTAAWKEAARLIAGTRYRAALAGRALPLGDDEAEALCMAEWGRRSGRVAEAVKKAGKRFP